MPDLVAIQEGFRSAFKLRVIAEKVFKLGGTYVLIGALISTVDAQISQPGIVAWTLVLGVFGAVIGLLGARAGDVLIAAAGSTALHILASIVAPTDGLNAADAIATGLLLGAIAGGLFRPWCRLSLGSFSIVGNLLRSVLPHPKRARSQVRLQTSAEAAQENARVQIDGTEDELPYRKAS